MLCDLTGQVKMRLDCLPSLSLHMTCSLQVVVLRRMILLIDVTVPFDPSLKVEVKVRRRCRAGQK
jgi:hypothetical protein